MCNRQNHLSLTNVLIAENYKDEEEDLYWSQNALELIDKLGATNWLLTQL